MTVALPSRRLLLLLLCVSSSAELAGSALTPGQCGTPSNQLLTAVLSRGRQVAGVPGAHLSPLEFTRFWISYSQRGVFAVGAGVPGAGARFCWADQAPLAAIRHVGLSTLDKHTAYRDIQLHPPARPPAAPAMPVRSPPDRSHSCGLHGTDRSPLRRRRLG